MNISKLFMQHVQIALRITAICKVTPIQIASLDDGLSVWRKNEDEQTGELYRIRRDCETPEQRDERLRL